MSDDERTRLEHLILWAWRACVLVALIVIAVRIEAVSDAVSSAEYRITEAVKKP